ncbi:jg17596, partial [Pararge aegeria aegeria]
SGGWLSEQLQHVQLRITDRARCQSAFNSNLVNAATICAGWNTNGRGTCTGDSGSPLVHNGVAIAVGIAPPALDSESRVVANCAHRPSNYSLRRDICSATLSLDTKFTCLARCRPTSSDVAWDIYGSRNLSLVDGLRASTRATFVSLDSRRTGFEW